MKNVIPKRKLDIVKVYPKSIAKVPRVNQPDMQGEIDGVVCWKVVIDS